ncbi:hypothetical protein Gogos_018310, partial [Gossypium gossypioides]|nr:hypothetical protein [Gossypium gossypioides]
NSVPPITPIGCNSHSPFQHRLGIPFPFLIFTSIFCPHQASLSDVSLPSIF